MKGGETVDLTRRSSPAGKDGDRSLDFYLREISRTPLLERNEEVRLAKRVKEGDQAALDQLVKANLRFVVSVAKQYQNQGLDMGDLINEGSLGLIKAAKRFDETRGFKFISYAVWWIRQAILVALSENSRIVRLPLNRVGSLYKIGKTRSELEQALGREPTDDDIAHALDGISIEEVVESRSLGASHLSLDAPFTAGEDGNLHDLLEDKQINDPEEDLEVAAVKQLLDKIIGRLDPREAEVLRLYFGLNNQTALTLDEIGLRFDLTRERVRQIKEKAIRRLRHQVRSLAGEESRAFQFLADQDRQKEKSMTRLVTPFIPATVKTAKQGTVELDLFDDQTTGDQGSGRQTQAETCEAEQAKDQAGPDIRVEQIRHMVESLLPVVETLPEKSCQVLVTYYGLGKALPVNGSSDPEAYYSMIEQSEKAIGQLMKITGRSYAELRHIFYQYRMFRLTGKL